MLSFVSVSALLDGMGPASCLVCASRDQVVLGPNPDFPPAEILMCRKCKFLYSYPMPAPAAVKELYREDYRSYLQEEPNDNFLHQRDRRAHAQKAFVVQQAPLPPWPSILDVGAAAGSLLNAFSDGGSRLAGFEPDHAMYSVARSRLPGAFLINEIFDPDALKGEKFDLVTLSHVLEHIADPIRFVGQLLSCLKDGGRLFVEVPHETARSVREIIDAKHRGMMHLTFFNDSTLRRVLEAAGAKVLAISTFGPRRDRFSIVPAANGRFIRRLKHKAGRIAEKLGIGRPDAVDWESSYFQESGSSGIWIRVVAQVSRSG